jgi:hypothetical protein
VLTWSTDPATSQAVTWRTAVEVPRGVAQITVAEAGPIIETTSRQLVASTVPLKTEINTAHYHSVNFEGLSPEIKYAYRVGDGVNWSEWFHFTTASPESKPFSFIYFGDAQNDLRARWSRVIREAYSDAPKAKFMIHAGDLVNRAEADHEWQEWHEAGAWINGMMPTIAVPGNHEMAKIDETSRRLSRHWGPQFAFPENGPEGVKETCYTLVYQGVRIIGSVAAEIQALLQRLRLTGINHSADEDMISPDHRRTPAAARQFGLPFDILGGRPLIGQTWAGRHARGIRAAKLRPVLLVCRHRRQTE